MSSKSRAPLILASKATASTPDISSEILFAIITLLAHPELAICARSSRLLYDISTPILYRVVYIELAENVNPLINIPAVASKGRMNYSGPRLAAKVAQARKARDLAEAADREADKKVKVVKDVGKKGRRLQKQGLS